MISTLQLIEASSKGELETVWSLVNNCRDPNELDAKNDEQITALIAATKNGHVDIVKFLLRAGANPLVKDNNGYGAMQWAAILGHSDIVKCIIQHIDFYDYDFSTHVIDSQFQLPPSYGPQMKMGAGQAMSSSSCSSCTEVSAFLTKEAKELQSAIANENYAKARELILTSKVALLKIFGKENLERMLEWAAEKDDIEIFKKIHRSNKGALSYQKAFLIQAMHGKYEFIKHPYPFGMFFRGIDNLRLQQAIREHDSELIKGLLTLHELELKSQGYYFHFEKIIFGQDARSQGQMLLDTSHSRSLTLQWLHSNRPECVTELINSEHFMASLADVAWAILSGHNKLAQLLYKKVSEDKRTDLKNIRDNLSIARIASEFRAHIITRTLLKMNIPKTTILQIIEYESGGVLEFPQKERQVDFYSTVIANQKEKNKSLALACKFGKFETALLLLKHGAIPSLEKALEQITLLEKKPEDESACSVAPFVGSAGSKPVLLSAVSRELSGKDKGKDPILSVAEPTAQGVCELQAMQSDEKTMRLV